MSKQTANWNGHDWSLEWAEDLLYVSCRNPVWHNGLDETKWPTVEEVSATVGVVVRFYEVGETGEVVYQLHPTLQKSALAEVAYITYIQDEAGVVLAQDGQDISRSVYTNSTERCDAINRHDKRLNQAGFRFTGVSQHYVTTPDGTTAHQTVVVYMKIA